MIETIVVAVVFLVWINFLPFLAHLVFDDRFDAPVDGGARWLDGRPLLGPHKTWRGLGASLLGAAAAAPLIGLSVSAALAAAVLSMAGDLVTSFIKRRRRLDAGARAFGLDHALEGGLPLLVLAPALALTWLQAAAVWVIFLPLCYAGALFWHGALYRPPADSYPRIVRAPTRMREWRACHAPSARWHHWLNFENYFYYRIVMDRFFRVIGRYASGVDNVLCVDINEHTVELDDLPEAFDGFRVLLLTDLHLDGLPALTDALIKRVRGLSVDLCLIGGDIRMEMYGPIAPSVRLLQRLLTHVSARHGIFGVLGNHDCIEMLPELETAGVSMLVNEARAIEYGGDVLWLIGVDDPHFYKCDDLDYACRDLPSDGYRLLLAHSPEIYREAVDYGIGLYLCGHTHGGQICLPRIGPVFTHSSAPRFTAAGEWRYKNMVGYTSRGAGASGVPIRFNCPGEIALITLRRSAKESSPHPPQRRHATGASDRTTNGRVTA
jgi:predicted MPP superfamily phosphohydrolase